MPKGDTKKSAKYDVAVIGAGPAGMMAAGRAASLGLKVILLEKNSALGKKLLLTGNGRCNLSNAEFNLKSLVGNYNNGEFLFHAFSVFGPESTIKFFEELGVGMKIEKNKRAFPKSDDAEDVLEALRKYLVKNKVDMLFNSEIKDIEKKGNKISKIILKSKTTASGGVPLKAGKYILATGGKSYSHTGSDGLGYKLAEKMGHAIVSPAPALTPLIVKEEWVKSLQGISLKDTEISIFQCGKKQFKENGEILFTHFGLSGPAVLNISGRTGDSLKKGEAKIYIDLFPLLNQEQLQKGIEDMLKKYANKTVKNILSAFVPEKLAEVLVGVSGLDKDKIANNMSKIERGIMAKNLKNIVLTPEGVLGFEQALVTKGGISLKEIDHKTMKSKIIENLYFAGEIIDVDGKSGGFNLQMCWSTGYIAGENCK